MPSNVAAMPMGPGVCIGQASSTHGAVPPRLPSFSITIGETFSNVNHSKSDGSTSPPVVASVVVSEVGPLSSSTDPPSVDTSPTDSSVGSIDTSPSSASVVPTLVLAVVVPGPLVSAGSGTHVPERLPL